jgi:hypothetical protein
MELLMMAAILIHMDAVLVHLDHVGIIHRANARKA